MTISLKPIDRDNFRECIGLDVYPEQKEFVGSNVVSIAESKVYPHRVPLAVYNNDELVGFVMHGRDPEKFRHWIVRLMIDRAFQGRGFGRAAALALIDLMKHLDGCDEIFLCVVPENTFAQKLYSGLGFERTGEIHEGEIVMRLSLANSANQSKTQNPKSKDVS
jgi:diamine N-acetyltransferase